MSDSQSKNKPVVGIDLGTTYSLVAWVDAVGHPSTLINSEGDLTTPSVVFFDKKNVVVGKEAVRAAEFEPERIAQFAKRDMGRVHYHKNIHGEPLPPEVIQSLVLRKLKSDAELKLGAVDSAVITVPAYFDEPRRKATQDAGKLAGLDVLDILNEPTAAAISYGVQQGFVKLDGGATSREVVLVYDLGGGTFDVTLMEINGRQFNSLATAGDVYLGGIDWTERIVDFVGEQFMTEYQVDPRVDESALQSLMQQAEDAKRALTARSDTTIMCAFDGHRIRTTITRDQFLSMTSDLLDRTITTTKRVLREAKLEWKDVTRLLLVGGSSRMPAIGAALEQESGLTVDRSLSPDEAVAHGAAVYAALLAGKKTDGIRDIKVTNVNSHDLGILGVESSTGRNRRRIMIPRNTQLPCKSISKFTTFRDNQTSVLVNIIEGGDASGNNSTPIGKCTVSGLPADVKAGTEIEVTFRYRANGRIRVSAQIPSIGKEAKLDIERTSGLDDAQLDYWKNRIDAGLSDETLQSSSSSTEQLTSADAQPTAAKSNPDPQPTEKPKEAPPPKRSAKVDRAKASNAKADGSLSNTETKSTTPKLSKPKAVVEPPSTKQTPSDPETKPVASTAPPQEPVQTQETKPPAPTPKKAATAAAPTPSRVKPEKSPVTKKAIVDKPTATPAAAKIEPSADAPKTAVDDPTKAAALASTVNDASPDSVSVPPAVDSSTPAQVEPQQANVEIAPPDLAVSANTKELAEDSAAGSTGDSESDDDASDGPDTEALDAPTIEVEEESPEWLEQERSRVRMQALKVMGINTLLHVAVLAILALIILPNDILPSSLQIISTISEDPTDQPLDTEVLVQPDQIKEESKMEVVTDVVLETDDQFEIDVSDFEPSMVQQEETADTGGQNAPMAGEMSGRSKAGKSALVQKFGGTAESEAAVAAGLLWLKNHQKPDGSWRFDHRCPNCDATCTQHGTISSSIGATSMALLAYMGAGNSYIDGDHQATVKAALDYILKNGKDTPYGLDLRGDAGGNSGMYTHGIASICLAEAFAMNEMAMAKTARKEIKIGNTSRRQVFKDTKVLRMATEEAIRFIASAQSKTRGGWRYDPTKDDSDTSVVGWQVMALKSAKASGIAIPQVTLKGIDFYLNSVTKDGAEYGYSNPTPKPSTSAIGLLCRIQMGWKKNTPALKRGVQILSDRGPDANNMYYNYYATQVLHQWGGDEWKKWNDVMRERLVKTQKKKGHAVGSWDLADPHGGAGGRLYMTCLATMTLEVYYRHLPIYEQLK
jgi:molecular chaperone DnaK